VAVLLLVILVLLIWLWWAGFWREAIVGLCALIGAVIGDGVGRRILLAKKAKRIFRQQKSLHRPYELSWTAEAITLASERGTSAIPWTDFHKYRETADQFLLFLSDANFLMVPKRAFSDISRLDAFRGVVTERIPVR